MIASGLIGAGIFSVILDRLRSYKLILCICIVLASAAAAAMYCVLFVFNPTT